jgi:hypothetical protein
LRVTRRFCPSAGRGNPNCNRRTTTSRIGWPQSGRTSSPEEARRGELIQALWPLDQLNLKVIKLTFDTGLLSVPGWQWNRFDVTPVTSAARTKPIQNAERVNQEQEVRPMPYARCSECGQTIQVEKVSNDVMMMWHGTHCGSSQAYFADKEIFETADDLEKKKPVATRRGPDHHVSSSLASRPPHRLAGRRLVAAK